MYKKKLKICLSATSRSIPISHILSVIIVIIIINQVFMHIYAAYENGRESRNKAPAHRQYLTQVVIIVLRLQQGFILKLGPALTHLHIFKSA